MSPSAVFPTRTAASSQLVEKNSSELVRLASAFFDQCFEESFQIPDLHYYCFSHLRASDLVAITTTSKCFAQWRRKSLIWQNILKIVIQPSNLEEFSSLSELFNQPCSLVCPLELDLQCFKISCEQLTSEFARYPNFIERVTMIALRQEDRGASGWHALYNQFTSLKKLDLQRNHLDRESLQLLTSSELVKRLEWLGLYENATKSAGLKLIASTDFQHLKTLDLSRNSFSMLHGFSFLQGAPFLKNLEHLFLCMCALPSDALINLAREDLSCLKVLDLSHNAISESGAASLANNKLEHLVSLNLSWNGIGPEGTRAILKANFCVLETLNLSGNIIGGQGLDQLEAVYYSKSLKRLYLHRCLLGDQGVQSLLEVFWENLLELNLCENRLSETGANALSRARLDQLEVLDLSRNHSLDSEMVRAFCYGSWNQLAELNLSETYPGLEGARTLAAASFPKLVCLHLNSNMLGFEELSAITSAQWLSQLQTLNLNSNSLGNSGAQVLSAARLDSITKLGLHFNGIEESGKRCLQEVGLGSFVS